MNTTDEQIKTVEKMAADLFQVCTIEGSGWTGEEQDQYAALTAILEELKLSRELLEAAKWIPVSERLPERVPNTHYSQVPCLVTHKGEVKILVFNHEHMVWDDDDYDDFYCQIGDVSAWMPIPDAFSEVRKQENL